METQEIAQRLIAAWLLGGLIGINRDSLETLEKKYLTRAAVSIASTQSWTYR